MDIFSRPGTPNLPEAEPTHAADIELTETLMIMKPELEYSTDENESLLDDEHEQEEKRDAIGSGTVIPVTLVLPPPEMPMSPRAVVPFGFPRGGVHRPVPIKAESPVTAPPVPVTAPPAPVTAPPATTVTVSPPPTQSGRMMGMVAIGLICPVRR